MPDAIEIRPSATVILVRQSTAGFQVFLARRDHRQSFMAGAYVFPGGSVDPADCDDQTASCLSAPDGFDPQRLLQDDTVTSAMARSLFVCAIRETFEETCVLLAHSADGHFIRFSAPQDAVRFAAHRRALNTGQTTLKDMARMEHLSFPLDALVPYAHWITPEIVPKRFSTRFFLARLPDGQTAETNSDELTDCLWVDPADAFRLYAKKEILLMPPTLKTLDELRAFTGLQDLFDHARQKEIYPILPQPEQNFLKLPHDPAYDLPGYKRPARPEEPCRLILYDGIWRMGFYPDATKP